MHASLPSTPKTPIYPMNIYPPKHLDPYTWPIMSQCLPENKKRNTEKNSNSRATR